VRIHLQKKGFPLGLLALSPVFHIGEYQLAHLIPLKLQYKWTISTPLRPIIIRVFKGLPNLIFYAIAFRFTFLKDTEAT
jgi:hypothetical protein